MEKIAPSLGRIVLYRLKAQDADAITRARRDRRDLGHPGGGNAVSAGETYPMMITRIWSSDGPCDVNGTVFLDGPDTHWVTSVQEGAEPGTWSPAWPPSL